MIPGTHTNAHYGYYDKMKALWPHRILEKAENWMIYIALFFNLMDIVFPQKTMMATLFIVNFIFYVPKFYRYFSRYGIDLPAYIAQASQFADGQTNYDKIGSVQGGCMYPAGHLWHYVPVWWMFLMTDKAEYIWKGVHMILHILIQYFIGKISYSYFRDRRNRAQMICFSMMLNERLRRFNTKMYNDSLMIFYMIFAVYLIVIHRMPKLASFFITISISLKVGALLILPSFLGIVQYQYGIYNLLAVISIIVSV